jgi:L-lysine exporter family protein LysE/ArgO
VPALELFISGFLLSLSLCLDIGIVNVALINTAIRAGRQPAFMLGLGSCFGDLFYAVLSVLGIGLLLDYLAVRWLLWLGGGAVLLYLSWNAARSALHASSPAEILPAALRQRDADLRQQFWRGLALALASPSAILWFAAVGGSVIARSGAATPLDLAALLGGFFCAGMAWSGFIAALAAHGGHIIGSRLRQYCYSVSALLFLYFAVRVIWDGYRQLL